MDRIWIQVKMTGPIGEANMATPGVVAECIRAELMEGAEGGGPYAFGVIGSDGHIEVESVTLVGYTDESGSIVAVEG